MPAAMLEPPSPELLQRLHDWQLCRPSDVRRARRFVRRLAYDLPAFDSVWIDALVQLGRLTPYQARVLESDCPENLRIGPLILLDELGRSAWGRTWLARMAADRSLRVVKQIVAPPERRADLAIRGRELAAAFTGLPTSQLVAPENFWEQGTASVFVSPYVHGAPLGELLLRRGRFPASIVAEIGRQLADGLEPWHRRQQVHGDVRLSHVRIDHRGRAILVEAGLRPVIEPEFTLHTSLSLEAYDGVAPELIGIGCPPTPAADLYALGCLLWQLLAGRAPFAVADPLAKLAAHQTRTIDDVREWAPDTPPALAELIRQLTHRDAAQRPIAAAAVTAQLTTLRLPGPRGVRRFRQQFDLAVPHLRTSSTVRRWSWPAATAAGVIAVAAGVLLSDAERRNELLSLAVSTEPRSTTEDDTAAATAALRSATAGLLPLPAPGADGIVWLSETGPYAVDTLRFPGALQIRAIDGATPEILIRSEPLRVACESLLLQGVTLRRDSTWSATVPVKALLMAHTQQITLTGTLWDTGEINPRRPVETPPVGLVWRLVEPLDPQAGRLQVSHSIFRGIGSAIFANRAARHVTADNLLMLGGDAWLDLHLDAADPPPQLRVQQFTLREARTFIRCRSDAAADLQTWLALTTTDCVFSPAATGGLLELECETPPVLHDQLVQWEGEASLLPADTPLLHWVNPSDRTRQRLPGEELPLEGLVTGRFTFTGLPTQNPADSVLDATDIPRRSLTLPGLRLDQLPAHLGGHPPAPVANVPLTLAPAPQ